MKLQIDQKPQSLAVSHWSEVEPFLENTRAALIHRPRHVAEHRISERYPAHLAIEAWCGTVFSGRKQFTFLSRVPEGRLLCQRCEVAAFAKGQPAAGSIMGEHVHLGRVVAQRTCCHHITSDKGAK